MSIYLTGIHGKNVMVTLPLAGLSQLQYNYRGMLHCWRAESAHAKLEARITLWYVQCQLHITQYGSTVYIGIAMVYPH